MGTAKREHTPVFKVQVALAAIRGDRTRSEVAAQYHLHLNLVAHWRKLLLANRADITYWPMPSGFLYLVATIDEFSRYVVVWRLSNTLEGWFGEEMLSEALGVGRPEVFNTDQGFSSRRRVGRTDWSRTEWR